MFATPMLRPSPLGERDALRAATEVAHEAGSFLLDVFGTVTAERKHDGSLVSAADREADRRITAGLAAAFPGDAVLSEESGTGCASTDRLWVVDPLDGTTNYCQGVPLWGVSLALVEHGRPVLAVCHFPTLRLTFQAMRGGGAWESGRRLYAASAVGVGADDVVAYCSRTARRYDLALEARGRTLGSAVLDYALVAAGTFPISLEATAHVWDLAAGWLLVEEAGGVVRTLDGEPVWPLRPGEYRDRVFPTVAAGNEALLAQALAGLRPRG
jgi:myo-inositol-1(or 4)-monophosphatase